MLTFPTPDRQDQMGPLEIGLQEIQAVVVASGRGGKESDQGVEFFLHGGEDRDGLHFRFPN